MAARAVAAIAGLVALLSAPAAHAAFGYRKPIAIDGSRVAGGASLTSFPVLVSISNDANLRSVANGGHVASELGYDIQFRASDGLTPLDHEIERYVPLSGTLVAWVRVPSLAAGISTQVYVYYGDPGVACPLARPRDVWDASFKAVYHLKGDVLESTGLAQDAVDFGTALTSGKIAAGRAFDGVSDFVETPVDDLRTADSFSMSLWIKANQTNFARHLLWQGQGGPLHQPEQAGANNGWGNPSSLDQEMHLSFGDITSTASVPDRLSFFLGNNDRALNPDVVSFSVPFTDTAGWHHVAVTVQNASTAPSAVMLVDGTQVCPGAGCDGSVSSTVAAPRGNWDTPLRLGRPGPAERFFDGILDEVHVSTTARSTGWLQTEFNNQNQPQKNAACTDGGFYCLGAEEAVSAPVTSCAAAGTPGADGPSTVAAAGTVVNRYAALAADAARGTSSVTVSDVASLTPLAAGDLLLVIQMQGASVNAGATGSLADSPRYGLVSGLGNAGRYEFATVQSIAGNTVNLRCALQNSYTASGKVQVIRVPQYTTLTVNAGASIVAPAWNGSTGGVVAIWATSVVLNGGIDVSGRGFRGGTGVQSLTATYGVTAYVAGATDLGGEKGEGIAGPASVLAGGRYGRGAPANGGGGGDGHNGSGGGGSNANSGAAWTGKGNPDRGAANAYDPAWNLEAAGFATSASSGGGRGGYTYSYYDQNALVVAPGDPLWTQDNRREAGGRGGHPLQPDAASRLYMGGGGGAGQMNDGAVAASASGGNGGGIVMVLAASVSSSSTPDCTTLTACIRADGAVGGSTAAGANIDGSGGGGGGGTVVVRTAASINGVGLRANGGAGGNQGSLACIAAPNECEAEGPGGGGGGGLITVYAPSGSFTRTAVGGANGTTGSAALTEFPPNGATRGAAGKSDAVAPCLTGACLTVAPAVSTCGNKLVMVTTDGTFNNGFDAAKKLLFESWGYTVTAIDDSTASYNAAALANNVIFLSNTVVANQNPGTKARVQTVGVVSEGAGDMTWQSLLFSPIAGSSAPGGGTAISIVSNTQSITAPFALGSLTIYSGAGDSLRYWTRDLTGTGIQSLAISTTTASHQFLMAVEKSAALYDANTAAGRRVLIGTVGSNPANWTASLNTLMQRSLGWGTCSTATAVTLMSFSATGIAGGVEISWRTGSELSNLGFNLYRSTSEAGPYERITSSLIPGLGSSPLGASYSYVDPGLVAGQVYYYRLEDVDTKSVSTFHGPVSAVPAELSVQPPPASSAGEAPETPGSTDGKTACPAWVWTAYASLATAGEASGTSCTRYGSPEAVSLDVTATTTGATVELRTGGFYAVRGGSGTVRTFVPGFDFPTDATAAALPLKRVLVDAPVGRGARVVSVEALGWSSYPGLVPAAVGRAEMAVAGDGAVRATHRALGRAALRAGLRFPPAVHLAGVSFLGEAKAVTVELSPLRFAAGRKTIQLAGRLRVRLAFAGVEPGERGNGFRGRHPRHGHETAKGGKNDGGPAVPGEPLARLYTTARGLHAVTFESLFPTGRRPITVSSLRLQRGGEAVALHVEPARPHFGPGGVLYFFAAETAASTDYTGEIAYELVAGTDGLAMPTLGAAASGPAAAGPPAGSASFEANRMYQAGLLDAPDLWLWDVVSGGFVRTKPFTLPGVDPSAPGTLVVYLQGASESGNDADHHVRAAVNGVEVGEVTFAGKQPWRLTAALPAGLVHEGANELTLTNPGDTGVASLVFLDRFTVEFPRTPAASGGVFEGRWSGSGAAAVAVTGVPAVVDVTTAAPQWLTGFTASGSAVRFQVEAGHRYVVAAREGLLAPRVATAEPTTLRDTANQADYVLIAPQAFLAAAQPLVERRQGQGLVVKSVSLEEIASAFGGGSPSAEAIHEFLAYVYHSWRRPSPRYALLLGGASQDPRNFTGTSRLSPLPYALQRTSFLWTGSDPALAAVNGEDDVPDLALGRLPAHTVAQAEALVAKVLDWEDSGQGLAGKAVLVADNPDPGGDFDADVDDVAQSFLGGRETQVIKLSQLGASTRPAVFDAWNAGSSLVSYVGHGAAAVWASEAIFTSFDAPSLLVQPRQPVLFTLNCLNGYFLAASYDSLGEALVKAAGRGAIASVAPSGLSVDGPAHVLHRALMAEVTSGRHQRLGDAFLAAQQSYARSGEMPELVRVYNLFGDPAMRIR